MSRHTVSELTGALLDAAVAKAEGDRARVERVVVSMFNEDGSLDRILVDEDRCLRIYKSYDGEEKGGFWLNYSGKWELGGPIIERERMNFATIGTGPADESGNYPIVAIPQGGGKAAEGPTHLIAAMRAYVAKQFGAEVEL